MAVEYLQLPLVVLCVVFTCTALPTYNEDECALNTNNCHSDALCINTNPGFKCVCKDGYVGDGIFCSNIDEDIDVGCPAGFTGDGISCVEISTPPSKKGTCPDESLVCDNSAFCSFDSATGSYSCKCHNGYEGNGTRCEEYYAPASPQATGVVSTSPSNYCPDNRLLCSPFATCRYDNVKDDFQCFCNRGFYGDGIHCFSGDSHQDGSSSLGRYCPDASLVCSPRATCTYNSAMTRFQCICDNGFVGDGISCHSNTGVPQTSGIQCPTSSLVCSSNAVCSFDFARNRFQCTCKPRYRGDGINCYPETTNPGMSTGRYCPDASLVCSPYATCGFDNVQRTYQCICDSGYYGDGINCYGANAPTVGPHPPGKFCPDASLVCSQQATCNYDLSHSRFLCKCNNGFYGDGINCFSSPNVMPSSGLCPDASNICSQNASCRYNYLLQQFECACDAGFVGNGSVCTRI